LVAADPRPRLTKGFRLPVIFAGNSAAAEGVGAVLGNRFDLIVEPNLRPLLEQENLGPAREAIHRLFLEHVMAQAPGYDKLLTWTSAPVMSTRGRWGRWCNWRRGRRRGRAGGGHRGATTDIFSVFGDQFNRTVSANLGMSYSVSNVMTEAGVENIRRWLPTPIADHEVRNRLRNKMIRPTTIPQSREDLLLEQAVAREALRLALAHHGRWPRG